MTEQPILITSIIAGEDITKNRCVGYSGELVPEGDPVFGIANADTAQGEQCPVIVSGIALVMTGSAVTVGDIVESFENGTVISSGSSTSYSNILVGFALDSASGADELIRVLLK